MKYKLAKIKDKKYFVKEGSNLTCMAFLHNNKYKTTIDIPNFEKEAVEYEEINKEDIPKLGYLYNENSSLKLLNTSLGINEDFIFEKNAYVQDIDIAKELAYYASDRGKAIVLFENDKQFKRYFDDNKISYEYYTDNNLKIHINDIDEDILTSFISLTNNERNLISAIKFFKIKNRENSEIGVPLFDGSNWLYDLLIAGEDAIVQQFNVKKYEAIEMKKRLLELQKDGILSVEHSTIKDIIKKADNGRIILLDIKEENKKLIKQVLAKNIKTELTIIDNIYHKANNLIYLLYDANIYESSVKNFKTFIVNKRSYSIVQDLVESVYYQEELKYLDYQYLLISEKGFPVLIDIDKYKPLKKITPTVTSSSRRKALNDFF